MRRLAIILCLAVLTTACDPTETAMQRAKRHYAMARDRGTQADRCAAAREVKAAALEANDQIGYDIAVGTVISDCG